MMEVESVNSVDSVDSSIGLVYCTHKKRSRCEDGLLQLDSIRDKLNQSPFCKMLLSTNARSSRSSTKRQRTNPFCFVKTLEGRNIKIEIDAANDNANALLLTSRQVIEQLQERIAIPIQDIKLLYRNSVISYTDDITLNQSAVLRMVEGFGAQRGQEHLYFSPR